MNAEWLKILSMVRTGELSVEEAAVRLGEVEPDATHEEEPLPAVQAMEAPYQLAPEDIEPDLGWWKNAWLILFWAGTGIIVLSAVFMGWAYNGSRGFWMFCSWLPMLLGIFILVVGWWSRQARWFHVRVQDSDGSRVNISAPLPLSLASWFLRVFGSRIPAMREKHMEDLHLVFDALEEAEGPVTIEVDDKDGDRVRVYIR